MREGLQYSGLQTAATLLVDLRGQSVSCYTYVNIRPLSAWARSESRLKNHREIECIHGTIHVAGDEANQSCTLILRGVLGWSYKHVTVSCSYDSCLVRTKKLSIIVMYTLPSIYRIMINVVSMCHARVYSHVIYACIYSNCPTHTAVHQT